jgi:hypothetical protein
VKLEKETLEDILLAEAEKRQQRTIIITLQ